jgi:uncharacterized protein YbaA (DUF1428 family)
MKTGYLDLFVCPVPTKNKRTYKKFVSLWAKSWMKHGALSMREFCGDEVPKGSTTSFHLATKLKKGEAVFISIAEFKSKSARNQAYVKVMNDPELKEFMDPRDLPFDGMRMFWGGFKPFHEGKK